MDIYIYSCMVSNMLTILLLLLVLGDGGSLLGVVTIRAVQDDVASLHVLQPRRVVTLSKGDGRLSRGSLIPCPGHTNAKCSGFYIIHYQSYTDLNPTWGAREASKVDV